jgi:probable H4MPT-linked C1 transfer pathway protein
MPTAVLGLDVGGANLKAVHTDGTARSLPFALWKRSAELPAALAALVRDMPGCDLFAVTMTGELCDCYESKRQGVAAILEAVEHAASGRPVRVWRTDGKFATPAEAKDSYLLTASANWHALGTWAGRHAPDGPALLVDIGSTTTDVIPLLHGKVVAKAKTDPERLRCSELVYVGARRTPLAMFMRGDGAAELFATTLDLFLLLGWHDEDPADCNTADGRPATQAHAHARLARMLCADLETCTEQERKDWTHILLLRVLTDLATAVVRVARTLPAAPQTVIVAGTGEKLARKVLEFQQVFPLGKGVSLSNILGAGRSAAACAHAVAVLAAEQPEC